MTDKLYIIGNGFDLHHGLKTSYIDFRDGYVKKRNPKMWNDLLDIYGDAPKQDNFWWKDFENMLGRVDYVHLEEDYYKLALAPSRVQNLLRNQIPPLFGYWINGIDTNAKIDETLGINPDSMFFTFNYTLVLENTYKVPNSYIWHIHGSVKNSDDIVIGHDLDEYKLFREFLEYQKVHNVKRKDIADNIRQMTAEGAKCVRDRIKQHEDDFYRLYANIKHFVAMGFSFNDIDMLYIEKIIAVNRKIADTDWTVYWHEDGEEDSIRSKLKLLGIKEDNIVPKRW